MIPFLNHILHVHKMADLKVLEIHLSEALYGKFKDDQSLYITRALGAQEVWTSPTLVGKYRDIEIHVSNSSSITIVSEQLT